MSADVPLISFAFLAHCCVLASLIDTRWEALRLLALGCEMGLMGFWVGRMAALVLT